jgi:hypothetical protein
MRFYDVSVSRSVPTEANRGLTSYINNLNLIKSYISERSSCLYRPTAGFWNVLDTLSDVIIFPQPEDSVMFQNLS